MMAICFTTYTLRLGADEIDPHATIEGDESVRDAAYTRFCELAEKWLDEHEGDAYSIGVELLGDGEIAGLYLSRDRREQLVRIDDPDHDEARSLTDAAYAAAWEALTAELQTAADIGTTEYAVRVPGQTAWADGLSLDEAKRQLEIANRTCQRGHIITSRLVRPNPSTRSRCRFRPLTRAVMEASPDFTVIRAEDWDGCRPSAVRYDLFLVNSTAAEMIDRASNLGLEVTSQAVQLDMETCPPGCDDTDAAIAYVWNRGPVVKIPDYEGSPHYHWYALETEDAADAEEAAPERGLAPPIESFSARCESLAALCEGIREELSSPSTEIGPYPSEVAHQLFLLGASALEQAQLHFTLASLKRTEADD